ncbi:MAG: hypothetical protein OEY89_08285 [Gammaproteobacteria bacterium]|nr:hypothetical protein [Gammaproteobacteria bacterium]
MGDFLLYRHSDVQNDDLNKALYVLKSQGSVNPVTKTHGQYTVHFYPKVYSPVVNFVEVKNGDFCGSSGSLFYKKQFAEKALSLLLSDFNEGKICEDDFSGVFTVVLKKNGCLYLVTDELGCSRVYTNQQRTMWSSSFLAISSSCQLLTPNRQGIYEYIFQEATFGIDTVFNEVDSLDSLCNYEYLDNGVRSIKKGLNYDLSISTNSYSSIVEENIEALVDEFKSIVDAFGNRITTALSGGYDTRLILALLQNENCKSNVYVYGADDSADVKVAKSIAQSEGFYIDHVNKSKYPVPEVGEYSSIIENNYYMLDGFPIEGIFDFGANMDTRISRAKTKNILLNGGGGAMYRNFYNLPEHPYTGGQYSLSDLIRVFYSSQTKNICQNVFSLTDYFDSFYEKLKYSLQLDYNKLTRAQVEFSFPAFRLRYWASKDNTNNTRLGSFSMPFVNPKTIKASLKIPLKFKNHGKIQAKFIRTINKRLAGYMSDYGYSFDRDPPVKYRFKDFLISRRPVFLRQRTYALKHSFMNKDLPLPIEKPFINEVLKLDDMIMSDYVVIDNIKDPMLLSRVYTLEYLFRKNL